MKTSALCRAGLILAAAGCLGRAAAAQTGADFDSAFGHIRAPLAAMSALKTKRQKPAAPKAPSAPDDVWQKVLETVKKDGKYMPSSGGPSMFNIEDIAGDPKAGYVMQGIAVLGALNKEMKFNAMGVILLVEASNDPKGGDRHIDHWRFETDVYGQVLTVLHETIILMPAGQDDRHTSDNLSPSDPKVRAQYDAMLKHWAERKPEGA